MDFYFYYLTSISKIGTIGVTKKNVSTYGGCLMNLYEQFIHELSTNDKIVLCQILRGDRITDEFQVKRTPLMTEKALFSLARQFLTLHNDDRSISMITLISALDFDHETVTCTFNELVSTEALYLLIRDIENKRIDNPEIAWNLGMVEQRLFLALLLEADWLSDEEEYYLPLETLRQICPNLKDLKLVCGSLVNLQIIENDKSVYVFSEMFFEKDGIHFLLNPIINWESVKQQLGALDFNTALKIQNSRTIPLYTKLLKTAKQHPKEDMHYLSMHELRSKLGITDDQYGKLSDFRKRVLEPAVSAIQQHLGTTISYEIDKDENNTIQFTFKTAPKIST